MNPLILRGNFSDLFGTAQLPVLNEIFSFEYEQAAKLRDKIFKKKVTDRDIEQATAVHDLDQFLLTPEGADYTLRAPKQGLSKTWTIKKYTNGFSISRESIEDGKFDLVADSVKKLAKSAKESQEINAMTMLNNGFTTATTPDGLSIFNTAHTLPSGLTFRNRAASDLDISQAALQAAISDFETQQIGDSGIIYSVKPKFLVTPSLTKMTAKELVGSVLKPGGQNNDINAIADEDLQAISSPHITDTDSWYLLADPMDHGLCVVERQALRTEMVPYLGALSDSVFYKASYREDVGAMHPYGVWGSTGA
jgi:hypothetical protein